jgi:3-methyladenine DNA glycosylase AlkD
LVLDDIEKIETLITTHSWWDSVDSLNSVVGHMCIMYPELKERVISRWSCSENHWLVRVAIIFQLKYKNQTDVELLSKVILENRNTNEFFINKAVGWILREYAKTNKEWVREFLQNNELSKLSIREAGKYL